MIEEKWGKRYKTSCQRKRLRDMAWRLLNNLLPGYLICFSIYSTILVKPRNQFSSFSIAVTAPTVALMMRLGYLMDRLECLMGRLGYLMGRLECLMGRLGCLPRGRLECLMGRLGLLGQGLLRRVGAAGFLIGQEGRKYPAPIPAAAGVVRL